MEKTCLELIVPDLGDAEKIELVKWYKSIGDPINEGDEILELVTDKAAFPMESPANGKLLEKSVLEGSIVQKGQVLGRMELAKG